MRRYMMNDDCLEGYFRSLKRFPLLDREEETALAEKIAQGDANSRKKLVHSNLRLAAKIASSLWRPGLSLADLIQEGNIGLLRAAEKFDGKRDVRFSTYAAFWIRQSIERSLANTGRMIRLPHRKQELLRKYKAEKNILSQKLQREPTTAEIGRKLGLAAGTLDGILVHSADAGGLSLEKDGDQVDQLDFCPDFTYSPERVFEENRARIETRRLLDILDARERKVISSRFGMDGGDRPSLKRLGQEMGLSPETVRQVEKNALKRMRREAENSCLGLTA